MWGGCLMKDFIDKTSEKTGTPINRANMMAIQGFLPSTVTYANGIRTITYSNGETLKTQLVGGSVVETFKGEKTITKTTSIMADGSIKEVVS